MVRSMTVKSRDDGYGFTLRGSAPVIVGAVRDGQYTYCTILNVLQGLHAIMCRGRLYTNAVLQLITVAFLGRMSSREGCRFSEVILAIFTLTWLGSSVICLSW